VHGSHAPLLVRVMRAGDELRRAAAGNQVNDEKDDRQDQKHVD